MVAEIIFGAKILISLILAFAALYLARKFDKDVLKRFGIDSYIRLISFIIIYSFAAVIISLIIVGYSIFEVLKIDWTMVLASAVNGFIIVIEVLVIIVLVKIVSGASVIFIDKWRKKITRNLKLKNIQIDLLREMVKWSIYLLGILLILNVLNLQGVATTFIASAGVIGIIIAFATQNLLQSFLAGVAISLDRSFEVGDSVNINGVSGKIDKVKIRTTRIKTWDGPIVILPNSKIMDATITNYSKHPYRRVSIRLDVEKSKLDKAVKTLRKQLIKLPWVIEEMGNSVVLEGYNIDFYSRIEMGHISIRLWGSNKDFWDNFRSTLELVDKLMKKNKIKYYNLHKA